MRYLKWRLTQGTYGEGPEQAITGRGGTAEAGAYVDNDGYRIGYLTESADLDDLADYDLSEITEAEALTFCHQFYADAAVMADGYISTLPPLIVE